MPGGCRVFWKFWVVACAASVLIAADSIAPLGKYTAAERRHWAFVKRAEPEVPKFSSAARAAWVKNPVDAFILSRLAKEGLAPSPRADRATLIRRLSFDLTGLPPSPAEVAAFAAGKSPGAYERLVDRLLNSPYYGERWGQHWLDLVRFAETDGFEYDTHRKDAWRYRDYVIRAFQNDKPYDRFIAEQLAGDEISPSEDETLIASGFNRLGPLRKNAGNQEVASSRNEVLTEMTNAVGSALLGVTLGCARCHDHKFDPIRHSDYYRIQAYFSGVQFDDVVRATPDEQTQWKSKAEPIEAEILKLRQSMRGKKGDELEAIRAKVEELEEKRPEPLAGLFAVALKPENRDSIHMLARGDFQNKGDRVGPRPLGVLLSDDAPELQADAKHPRTELAKWISDPENPLTARVMVNRIWHHHFGRGIVATPNDFGRMGERPSHPELLDYLANEFVSGGFSVKKIHRLILMSNTYQQVSSTPAAGIAGEKDPENKLLWKFSRRRLEAEEIRDAMLAVSGKLEKRAGGPSVLVPIDQGLVNALYKPSQWAVTPDKAEHNRRSVYLIAKRNLHLPFMEVFDAPDLQVSCPRRESSTHAPQALELLNGDTANQQAEVFAERLSAEAGPDPRKQIDLAYRLAAGRAPNAAEARVALEYLKTQRLKELALAMYNLNAFLYVN
ncbi:MAG: DUF1553 domain-containing protein [Bryobacterales bacterium]|nr:DUF1553 domain-containing protein [Bryobacterales bacterium]